MFDREYNIPGGHSIVMAVVFNRAKQYGAVGRHGVKHVNVLAFQVCQHNPVIMCPFIICLNLNLLHGRFVHGYLSFNNERLASAKPVQGMINRVKQYRSTVVPDVKDHRTVWTDNHKTRQQPNLTINTVRPCRHIGHRPSIDPAVGKGSTVFYFKLVQGSIVVKVTHGNGQELNFEFSISPNFVQLLEVVSH